MHTEKNILVLGAGRSSTSLIDYLLQNADKENWHVTVADMDIALATDKCGGHPRASAIGFNSNDEEARLRLIRQQQLVISMLPAFMHPAVARDCVEAGVHMATASYISKDLMALTQQALDKGIILLNECGLDPGIDHASAMQIIHRLKDQKAEILTFRSYCGGLVAPESNDNPWGYKFSWNPRNVVLAGQGTAQFMEDGKLRCLPYNRLFAESRQVNMGEYGTFDAYANRDSISYVGLYELQGIKNMLRGTLRESGYCKAWNLFVQLGLTDDSSVLTQSDRYTYAELLDMFLPAGKGDVKDRLRQMAGRDWDDDMEKKMNYLDLFSGKKIKLKEGSPAKILQELLEEKWKLKEGDKDMIVLQHQFVYQLPGAKQPRSLYSSLMVKGRDPKHTAMALTVGLPLAICVKNILNGSIQFRGVQLPTKKEIYEPLLKELKELGIDFREEERD